MSRFLVLILFFLQFGYSPLNINAAANSKLEKQYTFHQYLASAKSAENQLNKNNLDFSITYLGINLVADAYITSGLFKSDQPHPRSQFHRHRNGRFHLRI